jgi:hypothetical protein
MRFAAENMELKREPTTGDPINLLIPAGRRSMAEMNIADNRLKFWAKLAEAANDPWIYSLWRTPSLVFRDVVVSGV